MKPSKINSKSDTGGLQHYFDTIDAIKIAVDQIWNDMQVYKRKQTLNAKKLSNYLHFPPVV